MASALHVSWFFTSPEGEVKRWRYESGGQVHVYVRCSRTVMESLPLWFEHYNSLHPHKALGYRSPREFIASRQPG
jgi:transposase InsO family protein